MNINDNITIIKGIGKKTEQKLNNIGIFTILDLLLYIPKRYSSIKEITEFNDEYIDENIIINVEVKKICKNIRTSNGLIISTIYFFDGKNIFKAKWFNQPYMEYNFSIHNTYKIIGKIKKYKNEIILLNPSIVTSGYIKSGIVPIYQLNHSINNKLLLKIQREVLKNLKICDNIPRFIIDKYQLLSLEKSIKTIHDPKSYECLNRAIYRIKFQELLIYCIKILIVKEHRKNKLGIPFKICPELLKLKKILPFNLTESQLKVIREILIDEKHSKPMNRLLQGDVGSGKTIVAVIAMFNVIKNGYQAALLAPTEILAKQHYETITQLLKNFNVSIELLSGSINNKNKLKIKENLKKGNIDIIIGTHALIEDNVIFYKLGIIVTDEQHRFGVSQRNKLYCKGENPDILVMSATPIPRTLALYLYSDLNISKIDTLPPGRQKINTYFLNENERERAYKFALEQTKKGHQIYIVCPLIEKNEDTGIYSIEALKDEIKNYHFIEKEIAVLHGKMKQQEKDKIMEQFKNNTIKVLISTTVVEVGVNVPNATVMIIHNAERFGLAQLHQLRGRVGRGAQKSYCILIGKIKSNHTKLRIESVVKSNNGFFLAEEDLKSRGAGELLGVRQHGSNNFILADIIQDFDILKIASEEAKKILSSESLECKELKNLISNKIEQDLKFICFN